MDIEKIKAQILKIIYNGTAYPTPWMMTPMQSFTKVMSKSHHRLLRKQRIRSGRISFEKKF
jgi:hypothetical protein